MCGWFSRRSSVTKTPPELYLYVCLGVLMSWICLDHKSSSFRIRQHTRLFEPWMYTSEKQHFRIYQLSVQSTDSRQTAISWNITTSFVLPSNRYRYSSSNWQVHMPAGARVWSTGGAASRLSSLYFTSCQRVLVCVRVRVCTGAYFVFTSKYLFCWSWRRKGPSLWDSTVVGFIFWIIYLRICIPVVHCSCCVIGCCCCFCVCILHIEPCSF